MGGMFDPVHDGHMQLAQQIKQACGLDEILLVPCGSPVHRPQSNTPASARIAMLELAVRDKGGMQVDPRECRSDTPSYTYDTLSAIRSEQPNAVLHLLLGLDAFLAFSTWHRWQEIFELAHVIVVARPGYELSEAKLESVLRDELRKRKVDEVDDVKHSSAGKILFLSLKTADISSTEVRMSVRSHKDVSQYLDEDVAAYIRTHKLYQ